MVICKASNLSYPLLSLNFSSKTSPEHLPYLQPYPSLRNKCRVFSSSTDNPRWSSRDEHLANGINHHCGDRRYKGANDDGGGGGGGERKVNCEVEVISWRERRVKAQILVNADIESLWNALTDYERLADFIPNLICRLTIVNSMVDGDFKKFEGKWCLKSGKRSITTILSYEVNVIPRFNFPAIFLERIIRSDLPVNLQALACRAERNFEGNQNALITESILGTTSMAFPISPGTDIDGALSEKDKLSPGELKENYASSFGRLSPSSSDLSSKWGVGKFNVLLIDCIQYLVL